MLKKLTTKIDNFIQQEIKHQGIKLEHNMETRVVSGEDLKSIGDIQEQFGSELQKTDYAKLEEDMHRNNLN